MNATDRKHLDRCVDLAEMALDEGNFPFGSVLVDGSGRVLAEDRNREVTGNDATLHPEFELARWAAANMTPEERALHTYAANRSLELEKAIRAVVSVTEPRTDAPPSYPAGHGWTPSTTPFSTGDACRVMLARYACNYAREQHDPDLPPEGLDVFGYRRGRFSAQPGGDG